MRVLVQAVVSACLLQEQISIKYSQHKGYVMEGRGCGFMILARPWNTLIQPAADLYDICAKFIQKKPPSEVAFGV